MTIKSLFIGITIELIKSIFKNLIESLSKSLISLNLNFVKLIEVCLIIKKTKKKDAKKIANAGKKIKYSIFNFNKLPKYKKIFVKRDVNK